MRAKSGVVNNQPFLETCLLPIQAISKYLISSTLTVKNCFRNS